MRCATALSVALAVAFAAGCGGSEEKPPAPAPPPASAPRPAAPPAAPPATAPAPPPGAPAAPAPKVGGGDAARGALLYATYCASCHGAKGDGDGPVAAGLNPKPVAHSNAAYMNSLSDEHLFLVIAKGGPAVGKSPLMPGWAGTLSDAQIRDVIAYVRTLAR